TALFKSLKLVIPGLRAYIDYSLSAPVVMMEDLRGKAALARSESLVDRLRSPMISIQARNIFISSMVLIASPVIFVLFGMLGSVISAESLEIAVKRDGAIPAFIFIPLALVTVPWLLLILFQPLIAGATAIYYFKVRQAGGEILNEGFTQELEVPEENRRVHPFLKRTAMLTTISALAVLLAAW